MSLPTLQTKIPLRSIPEQKLNTMLIRDFLPFLSKLLSLTDNVSAERLEMALPAIKTQCIGMGFDEIVKMFEFYVDGKMTIQPISNYFDRVLFGQIVKEWKSINAMKNTITKIPTINEKEKKEYLKEGILKELQFFKENRFCSGKRFYLYDLFEKKGLINLSLEEKKAIKKDAIEILIKEYQGKKASSITENKEIKNTIRALLIGKSDKIKIKCKNLALEDYLRTAIKDEIELKKIYKIYE